MKSVFVVLVLVGVAAAGAHYVGEPYNQGFRDHPIVVTLHVGLGGVYLLLVPFQFVRTIRERRITYHRYAGRGIVVLATLVGVTAFFLAVVVPFSGWSERIIVGGFALFFLVALGLSVRHICAGRVGPHREWMIRSVSIALAISTMRLVFIPALVFVGSSTEQEARTLSILSFALAFTVHAVGAELWIRRTRDRSLVTGARPGAGARAAGG